MDPFPTVIIFISVLFVFRHYNFFIIVFILCFLLGQNRRTIILKDLNYELPETYEDFVKEFKVSKHKERLDLYVADFIDSSMQNTNSLEIHESTINALKQNFLSQRDQIFSNQFSQTKVAYLDVSSRLGLANSVTPVKPNQTSPNSLLQALTEDLTEKETLRFLLHLNI